MLAPVSIVVTMSNSPQLHELADSDFEWEPYIPHVGALRNHNLVVAVCPYPLTGHHLPVISICRHAILLVRTNSLDLASKHYHLVAMQDESQQLVETDVLFKGCLVKVANRCVPIQYRTSS